MTIESRLPGFAEWARVRDWRVGQIEKMANVEVYPASELEPAHVHELAPDHVVIATGARWRRDGFGRANNDPVPGSEGAHVLSPDEVVAGGERLASEGPVVVFDDDHYYMGNICAEVLRRAGRAVTLVTPGSDIASFTRNTLELERVALHMHEIGVAMITHHNLIAVGNDSVTLRHVHTGSEHALPAATVVMVTARLPVDSLYHDLMAEPGALEAAGIRSVARIGDCLAPGAIVHATFAGHRYAREFDTAPAGPPIPPRVSAGVAVLN